MQGSRPDTVHEQSQIARALQQAITETSNLEEAARNLAERLQPVLQPSPPMPYDGSEKYATKENMSPTRETIASIAGRIAAVSANIASLVERLEI